MVDLSLEERFAKLQFSNKARLNLYRKLSKMLTQGVPLLKAIEEYRNRVFQAEGKGSATAKLLSVWERNLRNGQAFGVAIDGWVPDTERMIIAASENGGKLEQGLLSAAAISVNSTKISKAISGGLAYPFVVFAMALGYVYLFGTKVIPEFATIVNPEQWTGLAYSLYVMSQFVQTKFIYVLAGFGGFVAIVFILMPLWTGRLRVWFDDVPPFSIYRMLHGGGFLVAFAALIAAGVTIEKAIEKLRPGASRWLTERLDGTLELVKSGSSFGAALRDAGHNFPARELVDDLVVYSSYSGFDTALSTLTDEWMSEGVERITTLMKVVNSAAILFLALVVVWLVGGFFGIQNELAAMAQRGGR
jgi:type II secretory pathway component PulF